MLEKFKLIFNALSPSDKAAAIKYILSSQNVQSLNEGYFSGPSETIEKGLHTGPFSSSQKCPACGK